MIQSHAERHARLTRLARQFNNDWPARYKLMLLSEHDLAELVARLLAGEANPIPGLVGLPADAFVVDATDVYFNPQTKQLAVHIRHESFPPKEEGCDATMVESGLPPPVEGLKQIVTARRE